MKMASSSASLGPDLHNHDHQMLTMIRKPMKPLMLKDFLLDDFSSCSSNGFKSFPRRQCCTTVRFLLEIDLKQRSSSSDHRKKKSHHVQRLQRSRSRSSSSSSSTMSALQRASDAVINAFKHFPFPSVKKRSSSPSPSLLPRTLSRKLFFWGKSDKIRGNRIGRSRLTLTDQALEEHYEPSDQNTTTTTTTLPTVVITTTTGRVSTSTSSNSKSNSWCDSEFASDMLSSTENDVAEGEKEVLQTVNNKVDITVGEDSTEATHTPKEWPNEEEKEQFSPISVLDYPFEDDHHHHDHHETSSPFHHKLARLEGNKQKLLQKIRRFENLEQLEPVDLEKRIAMSELEYKLVKISIHEDNDHDKRKESERKAREMMKLIKINSSRTTGTSTPLKINNLVSKVDNLLFDFFRESVMEESKAKGMSEQKEALREAEDWVNGETRQVLLGWEVKEARNAYVKDMEKGGKWTKLDDEKQEICFELEFQLLDSLVQELLLDLL